MGKDFRRKIGAIGCAGMLGGALLFGGAAVSPGAAEQQQTVSQPGIEQAYAKSRKVYIAPYSGSKYHSTKHCRGLRRARSVKKISVKTAKRQGYSKCRLCW